MVNFIASLQDKAHHVIVLGDFNVGPRYFEAAMKARNANKGQKQSIFLNAIPDVKFTSLSPSNFTTCIDQIWYYQKDSAIFKRKDIDEGPTIVEPNDPNALIRHSPQNGQPDYQTYFSDHAMVFVEFEVAVAPSFPEKRCGEPVCGDLLAIVQQSEMKNIQRQYPTAIDMSSVI